MKNDMEDSEPNIFENEPAYNSAGEAIKALDETEGWSFGNITYLAAAEQELTILFGWSTVEPEVQEDGSLDPIEDLLLIGKGGGMYMPLKKPASQEGDAEVIFVQHGAIPEGPVADMNVLVNQSENGVAEYDFGGDTVWLIGLSHVKKGMKGAFEDDPTIIAADHKAAKTAIYDT